MPLGDELNSICDYFRNKAFLLAAARRLTRTTTRRWRRDTVNGLSARSIVGLILTAVWTRLGSPRQSGAAGRNHFELRARGEVQIS